MTGYRKGLGYDAFIDNYVVLDIETTGLNANTDEIIELAAIKVCNGRIVGEFCQLIKPEEPISNFITGINGITNEMVKDCPSIKEVLLEFSDFIGDSILMGYNIGSFDYPFISNNMERYYNVKLYNGYIDVLYLARKRIKDIRSYRLTTLCDYFGVSALHAHRALYDCYATHECYLKLNHGSDVHPSNEGMDYKKQHINRHIIKYSDETKSLRELQSFLLGVIADDVLKEKEVQSLIGWLEKNKHLSGCYPFDRVCVSIQKVLDDGIIEQHELNSLLSLFEEVTSPVKHITPIDCLNIDGKRICLTGEFTFGEKSDVAEVIAGKNGVCENTVNRNTDYLVVGGCGSTQWKCGNYGGKIKKSLELQDKGKCIKIVTEEDFFKHIT